jgi:hypothetical protein
MEPKRSFYLSGLTAYYIGKPPEPCPPVLLAKDRQEWFAGYSQGVAEDYFRQVHQERHQRR